MSVVVSSGVLLQLSPTKREFCCNFSRVWWRIGLGNRLPLGVPELPGGLPAQQGVRVEVNRAQELQGGAEVSVLRGGKPRQLRLRLRRDQGRSDG